MSKRSQFIEILEEQRLRREVKDQLTSLLEDVIKDELACVERSYAIDLAQANDHHKIELKSLKEEFVKECEELCRPDKHFIETLKIALSNDDVRSEIEGIIRDYEQNTDSDSLF